MDHPFNILGDSCWHLIADRKREMKQPDVALSQAFRILWQAQSAVYLGVSFAHPMATAFAETLERKSFNGEY